MKKLFYLFGFVLFFQYVLYATPAIEFARVSEGGSSKTTSFQAPKNETISLDYFKKTNSVQDAARRQQENGLKNQKPQTVKVEIPTEIDGDLFFDAQESLPTIGKGALKIGENNKAKVVEAQLVIPERTAVKPVVAELVRENRLIENPKDVITLSDKDFSQNFEMLRDNLENTVQRSKADTILLDVLENNNPVEAENIIFREKNNLMSQLVVDPFVVEDIINTLKLPNGKYKTSQQICSEHGLNYQNIIKSHQDFSNKINQINKKYDLEIAGKKINRAVASDMRTYNSATGEFSTMRTLSSADVDAINISRNGELSKAFDNYFVLDLSQPGKLTLTQLEGIKNIYQTIDLIQLKKSRSSDLKTFSSIISDATSSELRNLQEVQAILKEKYPFLRTNVEEKLLQQVKNSQLAHDVGALETAYLFSKQM